MEFTRDFDPEGYNERMDDLLIGQPCPDFSLPDLNGSDHHLSDYRNRIVIVNFWSAECPHVARTDRSIQACAAQWGERVVVLPVDSNSNESGAAIAAVAGEHRLPLVLVDENHQVADLYGAQTTPHIFVIDPQGILRYRGAVDDVTFRHREATRYYLEEAVEALLDGRLPEISTTAGYGCTIVRL
jgi:peroxiredoxin